MSPDTDPGIAEMLAIRRAVENRPHDQTVFELLDARLPHHAGDVVADFFDDGVQLTYGQLAELSRRLADQMERHGIRKGAHVALMMPNSAEWLITWMAVARLGAVLTAIDPSSTGAELSYLLTDSDAQCLVLHEDALATFRAIEDRPRSLREGPVICTTGDAAAGVLDFDEIVAAGSPDFEPSTPVAATDLLTIQYTSGTTGFPKGCLQTHEYWVISTAIISAVVGPDVRNVLTTFPLHYLDPQLQVLTAIRHGGTVHVARRHSLSRFMGWVRERHIHLCSMTPPVVNGIPVAADDADTDLRFITGFYFRGDEHRAAEERFGCVVREGFGMTEIGIGSILPAGATHMVGQGSCGLAAPFREVRICDPTGVELAPGESGELWVRGRGLFLGYHERPAANRDSFAGSWFRTGDLATVDENGYLRIVGRIKDMIKRAGQNISAAEVEATIQQHPDVVEAGVVAVPDERRREEAKAYVVLRDGASPETATPQALIAHCRERLSGFKVPRYWTYCDDFPRTPSNKIAKQRLVDAAADLRTGAFDAAEGVWR